MSLLSVAFEHVPELDEERVAILGSSRVGAVALLAAVRDRRIDAGVEFFGPTDFFSEYAREISRRRSKANSAIFPVSSTSTRPSSGPVAHVPGSPRPWAVHPVPGPSPPTPPGMRVRTWRFGELRSVRREPGHTQLVEVRPWQGRVQGVVRGHVPPASREPSSSPGEVLAHTASPQLPVRCPSPFPLA